MKVWETRLCRVMFFLGIVFLFFSLTPLLFFQVFHVGSLVLLGAGIFLMLLPQLYPHLANLSTRWPCRSLWGIVALGFGVLLIFLAFVLYAAYGNQPPASGEATVVVFGAQVKGNAPSLSLKRRLDKAAAYLKENPQANCVVSGGQGADESQPEAEVMYEYLLKEGIDSSRIAVEDQSHNSEENVRYSNLIIQQKGWSKQVVLVTDSYHQLRVSIYAGQMGWAYINLSSFTPVLLWMPSVIREFFGLFKAWMFPIA